MISFFWRKGFYFNSRLHFYHDLTFIHFIKNLFGFNMYFLHLFFSRIEHTYAANSLAKFRNNTPLLRELIISEQTIEFTYMLNYYLMVTFPVLLNLNFQFKLNLIPYYLTRTYKGLSLYINRPLKRRTRGRTFTGKPNNIFKVKDYWV